MLEIIEHTPSRMGLEDKRPTAGIMAGLFTLVSGASTLLLAYQGIQTLILGQPTDLMAWRYFGTAFFLLLTVISLERRKW